MNEKLKDAGTVPNIITLARLAFSPLVAKKLYEKPRKWWFPAALFLTSDVIDGALTTLEDKSDVFKKLGFRKSEFGRKADPAVDKLAVSQMLIAGTRNGRIPKSIAALALAQKAGVSSYTLYQSAQDNEVHVSQLGRYSEFATNLAVGSFFPIHEHVAPEYQSKARLVAGTIAVAGIGAAVASNFVLARETADQTWTPVH